MKSILFNLIIIMGLFSFFSCKNNNEENKKEIILESKSNYDLFLLVKSLDTTLITTNINETISLEKYPFIANNIIKQFDNKWTLIKVDKRIHPTIFFVLVGTLSEAKIAQVIGLGINTKDKSKSFYSVIGGTTYEESSGEYITGRLETSVNFKYHLFSHDSINFAFEVIQQKENKNSILDYLNYNGFNVDNLK